MKLTGDHGKDFSVSHVHLADSLAATGIDEARRIGLRTKEALAAYKAHRRVSRRIRATYPDGVPGKVVDAVAGKLGASLPLCRNLTQAARLKGAMAEGLAHRLHADEAHVDPAPRGPCGPHIASRPPRAARPIHPSSPRSATDRGKQDPCRYLLGSKLR